MMIRLLISGGPGSGCTTAAKALGERLGIPVVGSDTYFHKPTDPPFQEQYTLEERRALLRPVLAPESSWILSGSVATWGLHALVPTHGVFLNTPTAIRLQRLLDRQRAQFGSRIDPGGDLQEEHDAFLEWAAGYEERAGTGRNLATDRAFVESPSARFVELDGEEVLDEIVARMEKFVATGGLGGSLPWRGTLCI